MRYYMYTLKTESTHGLQTSVKSASLTKKASTKGIEILLMLITVWVFDDPRG